MDVNLPEASEMIQDSALDLTPLPTNQAPKFWAEAKQIYQNSTPPFVRVRTPLEASRAVFVAKDGQRPVLPIRANLTSQPWGENANSGAFWSLDLNRERLIVTSFPNNGCVSGAKWIYRSWTGVKDVFEDLPVAFTCINGIYPKNAAAAEERHAANRDTVDNTIAHIPFRVYSSKPTSLPDNHPVEYLFEARASYMHSRPPFAIRRTKRSRRRVLLAMKDGRFSANSAEALVVYREWDELDDYPTLDLDGKRFIVMGNAGPPPSGFQYHLWLGLKVGRVEKVVAYAGPSWKASSGLPENVPEIIEISSRSSYSGDEEDQGLQVGSTENSQYSYDNFIKAFDVNVTPSSSPAMFSTPQPVSSSGKPGRTRLSLRERKPTKRTKSPTPPTPSELRKGKSQAKYQKRISHKIRHTSDDSFGISNESFQAPTPSPSTNDRSTLTSHAPNIPAQAPASVPNLTLHQQTHTTLRVTRDSNIMGFVPLRLRACMSLTALFDSVVTASGGHNHHEYEEDLEKEPVKCVMAVFDWKADDDLYKTIFIDRGTEGSFEIFLEIIDEAPCWKEEGGKCGIAVEIVRS